jgi:hypothetical protein
MYPSEMVVWQRIVASFLLDTLLWENTKREEKGDFLLL